MERERFDGADINHLLRARGSQMDWERLLARFGVNWRVLLCHLIVYGFVYPDEQGAIPARVLLALTERLHKEPGSSPVVHLCRGPLSSRTQYLPDIEQWGYVDAGWPPGPDDRRTGYTLDGRGALNPNSSERLKRQDARREMLVSQKGNAARHRPASHHNWHHSCKMTISHPDGHQLIHRLAFKNFGS